MSRKQIKLRPLTLSEKKREERRLKNAKRLNLFLLVVVLAGLAICLHHGLGHRSSAPVVINYSDQKGTLNDWIQSGFVKSIDTSAGTVVLEDARWNELSAPQKASVEILLRDYCARRNGSKESKLIIVGDHSRQVLVTTEMVSISGKQEPLR